MERRAPRVLSASLPVPVAYRLLSYPLALSMCAAYIQEPNLLGRLQRWARSSQRGFTIRGFYYQSRTQLASMTFYS